MIEFFTILFFGKTILLTPSEIDIDVGNVVYELPLDEPLVAVSGGASIQIDVTNMLKLDESMTVRQFREVATIRFRGSAILANLIAESATIRLDFDGATSVDENSVRIILEADDIPLDLEFNRLTLETSVPLRQVSVFWKNYSK